MKNWLWEFPSGIRIEWADSIDAFVRYLNINYNEFFTSLKAVLNAFISVIYQGLNFVPWWLFIILVIIAAKKLLGSYRTGILYGALLFLVGAFGYWNMMNETLSIVITSVFFSLAIGLPAGILISTSKRANSLVRPLLDGMQTMPTFVYMIPAVMLLGPGKVPAVLATVIYAVVPVVRLTSHGIQQVDKEVVEASRAFGSSRWQTLAKVQVPLALPTIMTGINQTMMMAVAMVVTCAMIGANGLGMEVLIAINRTESGRGIIAGLSIVILAIIIDRLTQSFSAKGEVK
ncbi:MAG TPA: ABC transporter permease subunit [Candidatus Avacidaminococcus intestinavium]|uniref:ABC transporter permease subunit n=1 Tax=Candidatus Avacidaminococcus intestinavium TaxID=2840684 RepID=A0A9D1SLK9_9FIRM|nr:ABC transporter permease subunit [Candidatus Avacidaminococcus intestinavium]